MIDKVDVHDVSIQGRNPYVEKHNDEVPLVGVADAAAGECAVVISLQHARAAGMAVVGARRGVALTHTAEPPPLLEDGGQHDTPDTGLCRHHHHDVAHHIEVNEQCSCDVSVVHNVTVVETVVQKRQHDKHFKYEHAMDPEEEEEKGEPVGGRLGEPMQQYMAQHGHFLVTGQKLSTAKVQL